MALLHSAVDADNGTEAHRKCCSGRCDQTCGDFSRRRRGNCHWPIGLGLCACLQFGVTSRLGRIRTHQDDPNDDTWSFFVRNWGNEGFCSTNDHRVSTRQMTVRLPRLGAVDVQLLCAPNRRRSHEADFSLLRGNRSWWWRRFGDISAAPADQHGVVFGELHLKWRRKLSTEMLATLAKPVDREMLSSLRPRRDLAQASQGAEELLTQRLKASTGMSKESQLLASRPAAPQRWRRLQGRVVRVAPAPPVPEAPLIQSVVVRPDALTQRRAKAALSLTPQ